MLFEFAKFDWLQQLLLLLQYPLLLYTLFQVDAADTLLVFYIVQLLEQLELLHLFI